MAGHLPGGLVLYVYYHYACTIVHHDHGRENLFSGVGIVQNYS